MIWLIIYIVGCLAAIVIFVKGAIDKYCEITIGDLGVIIALSIFSWIGAIIAFSVIYEDKVIYRKKEKV